MAPLTSTRLAWSIAFASLALWVANVPWAEARGGAERILQQTPDETIDSTATPSLVEDSPANAVPTTLDDGGTLNWPCSPAPGVGMPLTPVPAVSDAREGAFHLCGADAAAARAIEQLIAGRGFSSTLSTGGNGCADLTIRVTSPAMTGGRAASNLNVSLGSGLSLSIQIVSEGGATRVSIRPDQ